MYRYSLQSMIVGYVVSTAKEPKHIHRSVLCRRLEDSPKLTEVEATSALHDVDARRSVVVGGTRWLVRICKECAGMASDPGEWMTQGACASLTASEAEVYSLDLPDSCREVVAAKRRCETCPVRARCLQVGMSQTSGTWGGYTAAEREEIARSETATRRRLRRRQLKTAAAT